VRNAANPFDVAQFAAIQAVAPSLGVELTPIIARDPGEMERDLTAFVHERNGGLIVTGVGVQQIQRDTIIAATAQHQLPPVSPFRGFVVQGGLLSDGTDQPDPYRLPPGYVDPTQRGEKPAKRPGRAQNKSDLAATLKNAGTRREIDAAFATFAD